MRSALTNAQRAESEKRLHGRFFFAILARVGGIWEKQLRARSARGAARPDIRRSIVILRIEERGSKMEIENANPPSTPRGEGGGSEMEFEETKPTSLWRPSQITAG